MSAYGKDDRADDKSNLYQVNCYVQSLVKVSHLLYDDESSLAACPGRDPCKADRGYDLKHVTTDGNSVHLSHVKALASVGVCCGFLDESVTL